MRSRKKLNECQSEIKQLQKEIVLLESMIKSYDERIVNLEKTFYSLADIKKREEQESEMAKKKKWLTSYPDKTNNKKVVTTDE